jgi:hypothetical protein
LGKLGKNNGKWKVCQFPHLYPIRFFYRYFTDKMNFHHFFRLFLITEFKEVDLAECDCPKRCPQTLIYAPICGYNGNTFRIFDSACAMGNINCENPEEKCMCVIIFNFRLLF